MSKSLKIIFMGTPDYVAPTLKKLIAHHNVIAVYTQPPRPKGRGQKEPQKSPVHIVAESKGIPVYTPSDFKNEHDIAIFQNLSPDIAVVAAYGMLLPQAVLDIPKYGCLNIHPSLLPRWRGSAPIQFAIWKGDHETGVSVMQLVKKMDAGPIISQANQLIDRYDFSTLNTILWEKGTTLVLQALKNLEETGRITSTPQSETGITFTHMLEKKHGRINWAEGAGQIDRQIRALNPWPGTWCETENGKRIKIIEAQGPSSHKERQSPGYVLNMSGDVVCGDEMLVRLGKIQPEGKMPMDIVSAINGGYLRPGDILK